MKKRIMAILFAMTLVAAMLPAGLAVTAAAAENLIVNGSFEENSIEGDANQDKSVPVTWKITSWQMGAHTAYTNAEVMGAVTPAPGGGNSCFAVKDAKENLHITMYQVVKLEAGKQYTASFLLNLLSNDPALGAYVRLNATSPASPYGGSAGDVALLKNIKYDQKTNGWRRVSKTFEVPGTPGEEVDAVFYFHLYGRKPAEYKAYIDNVSIVEAETQEKILFTVDGFENYGKPSANGLLEAPVFPFAGNSGLRGYNGSNWTNANSQYYLTGLQTLPFVTHADGNTVMQFKSHDYVSYIRFDVPSSIDFTGIEKGTPIRISYKARLVNVPEEVTEGETFAMASYMTTTDGLIDQATYTVTAADEAAGNVTVTSTSEVVTAGTKVHLVYPSGNTPYMFPLEFSRDTVVADDNENAWTQYDVVIPYEGKVKTVYFTSFAKLKPPYYEYTLDHGYDWEMDDFVVTVADTDIIAGPGAAGEVVRNTSGEFPAQAWENADGTGTEYTVTGIKKAHDAFITLPYYKTQLDADKNVKAYGKNGTAAGAAYISAEDAAGASVVTAVYKTVDGDRTLVGVNVKNAAAGLVAAPEVALSAITEEAGTYEVATYILALTTGTLKPLGESAIVQIQ